MDVVPGEPGQVVHAHTTLEPWSRLEFERYFLFLRLFLLFTPVFILLAYGHPAVSSAIIDTVAISVDCTAAWLLLRFRPDTLLRYQLLLRGGDIALGYLVLHNLHAEVGNVYYDSVYVLFVVAAAATHGRRGAALLSVGAALLVLLGRIQLAWEGVFPFQARHVTDSLYYALLFLLAGNTTAFLIRKSREPALLRALHDPLTGLPNRLLLDDRLRQTILQAQRTEETFALLFLDLDNFKAINDSWGHTAGDLVLRAVTSRLRATFRESDTVARVGGEEFAILLPRADEDAAELSASKIVTALHHPIHAGKAHVTVRASIGSAIYPRDGATMEALIAVADAAMYTAKRAGAGFLEKPPSAPAAL